MKLCKVSRLDTNSEQISYKVHHAQLGEEPTSPQAACYTNTSTNHIEGPGKWKIRRHHGVN